MSLWSQLVARIRTVAPLRWAANFGIGQPVSPTVTDTSLWNAYLANPWVFAGVRAIGTSAATVPLQVVRKASDGTLELLPQHKAARALQYVNGTDSTYTLVEAIVSSLCLDGNAYLNLIRPRPGAPPTGIQWLPPSHVRIIPGEGERAELASGYEVSSGGRKIIVPDRDIVHCKLFGGDDQYYGASPLKPLMQVLNAWGYNMTTQEGFFKRGGLPTGILKAIADLTSAQRKQLAEAWRQWRSAGSAELPLILGQDLEYKALGATPDSVLAIEFPNALREMILAVLGVPPVIVGIFEFANYANSQVQRKLFWQETVLDYLARIEATLTEQFLPEFGERDESVRAHFDTSKVDALQEDFATEATSVMGLVTNGILTINEARAKLPGSYDAVPWGDTWYGPFSLGPIASVSGAVLAPAPKTPAIPPPPEPEPKALTGGRVRVVPTPRERRLTTEQRVAWARSFDNTREKHEESLAKRVGTWFADIGAESVGKIEADRRLSRAIRAEDPLVESLLFNEDDALAALVKIVQPALAEAYASAGKQAVTEQGLGITFDPDTSVAQRMLEARTQRMKTVVSNHQDTLRKSLSEGLANGENVTTLTERVQAFVVNGREAHAPTVARTEVGSAMNTAAGEASMQAGADDLEWLAIQDERTREEHAEMDGKTRSIRDDEPFHVPDPNLGTVDMMHPGDSDAPVNQVANCRCTTAGVFREE